jgi:hypothetical protein
MKVNYIFFIVGYFSFLVLVSCSPEGAIKNPNFSPLIFSEDFAKGAVDNAILKTEGWNNISEIGTVKWKTQFFSGNVYAEFSPFQSGEPVNIGWLISPSINMDTFEGEILQFQASQSFVSSGANSLEVFIATNYNGTNMSQANWELISAKLPSMSSPFFEFLQSGEVDLSFYKGKINIAFKVKGSGTNAALDGSYQIDAIRIYTKKL